MKPDGSRVKFLESFVCAFKGIAFAILHERNIKIMLALAAVAVSIAFILQYDYISWLITFLLIGLVISAELFNTALEQVVDLVNPTYNALAGRCKDIAAGAVLVLCVIAAIIKIILMFHALSI